jgi:hypothetical protein
MDVDYHDFLMEKQDQSHENGEHHPVVVSLHLWRRPTPLHQKTPEKPGSAPPTSKKSATFTLNMG